MALTVKGAPITAIQQTNANIGLSAGKALNAPAAAMIACMYAAMGETSLGADPGMFGGVSVGVWQAQPPHYNSGHDTAGMATAFYQGGTDFQAGGAIHCAVRGDPPWMIANEVEANAVWINSRGDSYAHQWSGGQAQGLAEAQALVSAFGGGALGGGSAGLGGTGTGSNASSNAAFTVGGASNPTEDYWTAINRLAQERYWYLFSDGETMYLADGPDLMAQTPAVAIDRWGDSDRISHLEFTWDNTAFQYATTHKKRSKVQKRSQLAKVTSPVEATLDLVCEIDEVRAGDIVILSGCGPGDGKWLVGDCTRSVFSVYSTLTLVPALSPLPEQQVAGAGSNTLSGAAASKPGSGTVIAAMISAASTINNEKLPYVWGGGHARAGTPDIGIPGPGFDGHTVGFDCSGAVGAVLRAGGLWKPTSVGSDADVISTLRSSGLIVPGQGSGSPECTLFDRAGVHIFMRLNGQYFGTSDGFNGPSNVGLGGKGGGGGTWLTAGPDVGTFASYHFPQTVLAKAVA